MSARLADIFEEFNSILVICPCCGKVCRLGDARPYLKGCKPSMPFDRIERSMRQVERARERFDASELALRKEARLRGLRKAKGRLKEIDPLFSGSGLDPQDVKVLFDPVEYVVFDGLRASVLRRIVFMAEPPSDRRQERVQSSLGTALRKGNLEFITLRVTDEGVVVREP